MSAETDDPRPDTTVSLQRDTLDRLRSLKPYSSMSYDDLLSDMADQYDPEEAS